MESSNLTDEMIRAEKREYHRKWREQNRERVKSANRKYWQKRVEKKIAEQKIANGLAVQP